MTQEQFKQATPGTIYRIPRYDTRYQFMGYSGLDLLFRVAWHPDDEITKLPAHPFSWRAIMDRCVMGQMYEPTA